MSPGSLQSSASPFIRAPRIHWVGDDGLIFGSERAASDVSYTDLSYSDGDVEWILSCEWPGAPSFSVGRVPTGYLLRCQGSADFFVSEDGRDVSVVPLRGVNRTTVTHILEQQILPGVHQLAGAPALHASAVATPHGTVAFVGPSGAGKSTMAAMLSKHWRLVADDYLPLRVEGNTVVAHPSSAWVRLRDETFDRLGEPGTFRGGKTSVERQSESQPGALCCIYALGPASDAVGFRAVTRRDAIVVLASQLHRIDPSSRALLGAELEFIDAVTSRVPVRRLDYPRDFETFDEVEAAIIADLSALR